MKEDIVFAKDIVDCSVCPLNEHDCSDGWTSALCGNPAEPPCDFWDDDTKVYRGMYGNNDYL